MSYYKNRTVIEHFQPPIIGPGASVRLKGGYINLNTGGEFGSKFKYGFTLLFDCQVEKLGNHTFCGTASRKKTALMIYYLVKPKSQILRIRVRDDFGHNLIASNVLSRRASKRLLVRINPLLNNIEVTELTIQSTSDCSTEYSCKETPKEFSNLRLPLIISGFSFDSGRKSKFLGKVANFGIIDRYLHDEEINDLRTITQSELNDFYGIHPIIGPNYERRKLFSDDYSKLKAWLSKSSLNDNDTREASTLIYKWLFDKHPLLIDICDELGIQLTFPCQRPEGLAYMEKIQKMEPSFYQVGYHGVGSLHGHIWLPFSKFRNETAFSVDNYKVSHESYIKLVRHKLGGAHFDPDDRKKWQRDLKAYSDRILIGGDQPINYQMKSLITVIYQAVVGCGIKYQIQLQS